MKKFCGLINGCSVFVGMLQRIPVEEHYGAEFAYAVIERPFRTDRRTVADTLSSERSSFSWSLGRKPVELAVISKNEIGEALPSTVFSISLTSVLSQFSNL